MQQLFHKMNQCQDDPRSRYALDQLAHAVSHSSDGVQLLVIFPHLADQVLEMTLTQGTLKIETPITLSACDL